MARVVFMGTPEFAIPTLRALTRAHTVAGVVTQPDRPAGRGQRLAASPVKQFAAQAKLQLIQPTRLREAEAVRQIEAWRPEIIVVAAFGQILRPEVLGLPPHGCLNVHASLLPWHRGAAPIPAAILSGESKSGVTLMQMDAGLDTGPILAQRSEPIRPDDTTLTLSARLADMGARLLVEALPDYLAGQLKPQPQDENQATYAPQLKKEDGHLDFAQSALELDRRVRAFMPWPGAFALWRGRPLRILRTAVAPGPASGQPGTVRATAAGPCVSCGAGELQLLEVQPPGKRPMPAADFARGAAHFIGGQLT